MWKASEGHMGRQLRSWKAGLVVSVLSACLAPTVTSEHFSHPSQLGSEVRSTRPEMCDSPVILGHNITSRLDYTLAPPADFFEQFDNAEFTVLFPECACRVEAHLRVTLTFLGKSTRVLEQSNYFAMELPLECGHKGSAARSCTWELEVIQDRALNAIQNLAQCASGATNEPLASHLPIRRFRTGSLRISVTGLPCGPYSLTARVMSGSVAKPASSWYCLGESSGENLGPTHPKTAQTLSQKARAFSEEDAAYATEALFFVAHDASAESLHVRQTTSETLVGTGVTINETWPPLRHPLVNGIMYSRAELPLPTPSYLNDRPKSIRIGREHQLFNDDLLIALQSNIKRCVLTCMVCICP